MTIDYNFLSMRHNKEYGTEYQDGKAMVADLYAKLGSAYGVADRLIINHKSVYNFMKKHGMKTQPRGRERFTDKKDIILETLRITPNMPRQEIAALAGSSVSLVKYYVNRRRKKA